jgi:hypothetical protein
MKKMIIALLAASVLLCPGKAEANTISANASNYTSYLGGLMPGDTLALAAGNYTGQLNLSDRNGTPASPIVIMGAGNTTIFLGNACCNTVNITDCSFLVIKDFKIDGQNINYIDGVKAGGGEAHWAHHITLENLTIVNNGGNIIGDNQTVGISTKCPAWNWTIRGCTIIAAGTGLYLGNSDGTCPFVGGLIENNLVINTKGYNMEIKEQLDNVRDDFPGTSNDYQKTIIRYNVWSKDSGGTPIGVGDGSRPCILMDNFPSTGFGANDTYEVYGNFFYNNPTEALMQVTGNTTAYSNVFINHVAPAGYGTVVMNDHNGFPPRNMNMFHNTVLSTSPDDGISLSNANTSYQQHCYANVVFSGGTPISGFTLPNTVDNVTGTYAGAATHVNSTSTTLTALDLYPQAGQLQGTLTSSALFTGFTDHDVDFNGNAYNWIHRGAYSGSGANPGWHLQLAIRTTTGSSTGIAEDPGVHDFLGVVFPNPANNSFDLSITLEESTTLNILLTDLEGQTLRTLYTGMMQQGDHHLTTDVNGIASGFYLVSIRMPDRTITRKLLIQP